jgi:beta-phosphoglucomutase
MKIKYEAFLFDLDGVLIDSEEYRLETYRTVFFDLFQLKIEFNRDEFAGRSEKENIKSLLQQYNLEIEIDYLVEKRKQMLNDVARSLAILNPSIVNSIILAKMLDIKIAICTNSTKDYLDIILERLPEEASIDLKLTAEDVERPKPDPEIYNKAAKILDIRPKRCLVFEDSIWGIMAAKKANMDYIRVPEFSSQNFYQT